MAKKKKAVRSNEERILRVWDIETIKDLMSRRTIYEAQEQHAQELEDLWVQLPEHQATASFGKNWGYYVGMEEIRRYYVTEYEARVRQELKEIGKPEVPSGYGRFLFHPLSTPNVTLAEDGKTAQGTWYSIGDRLLSVGGRKGGLHMELPEDLRRLCEGARRLENLACDLLQ